MTTKRHMSNRKKKLRFEIESLTQQINAIGERRREKIAELLKEVSPFRVGQIVKWNGGRGRVVLVSPWLRDCSEVVLTVISIRKDGSEGAQRRVNHWDLPVIEEEAKE